MFTAVSSVLIVAHRNSRRSLSSFPDLKSAAGFLTMAVLSRGNPPPPPPPPPCIFASINYFRGRKDPERYRAAALQRRYRLCPSLFLVPTILLHRHPSSSPPVVFFQPDFSVSLGGMQFTELFLNPSGGTTAEPREKRSREKENTERNGRKRGRRRRRRNEVGGSHGVSCFAQEASTPRFLYVSLPGSPIPISPPIHSLHPFSTRIPIHLPFRTNARTVPRLSSFRNNFPKITVENHCDFGMVKRCYARISVRKVEAKRIDRAYSGWAYSEA